MDQRDRSHAAQGQDRIHTNMSRVIRSSVKLIQLTDDSQVEASGKHLCGERWVQLVDDVYHHCPHCKGYVRGHPLFDSHPITGDPPDSKGHFYCGRCGNNLN